MNDGIVSIAPAKEKYIIAALHEMKENGVSNLTIRCVAGRCGVSPGAIYKHFSNKNDLILSVYKYVNKKWEEEQEKALANALGTYRDKIVVISLAYIHFLCSNPEIQSIVMNNDRSMPPEQLAEKARLTNLTLELVRGYAKETEMPEEMFIRKEFTLRSFVYGAAMMINSGTIPLNEETDSLIRKIVDREFDLP